MRGGGGHRTTEAWAETEDMGTLGRLVRISPLVFPFSLLVTELALDAFGPPTYRLGDLVQDTLQLWPVLVLGLILPMVFLAAWIEAMTRVVAADAWQRPQRLLVPLRCTALLAGGWAIVGVSAAFHFLTGIASLLPIGTPVAGNEPSLTALTLALVVCQAAVSAGVLAVAAFFMAHAVRHAAAARDHDHSGPRLPTDGLIGTIGAFTAGRSLSFWAGVMLATTGFLDGATTLLMIALHFALPAVESDLALLGGQLALLAGLFVFGVVLLQGHGRVRRPGWDARGMHALVAATTLFAGLVLQLISPLRGAVVLTAAMMQFIHLAQARPAEVEPEVPYGEAAHGEGSHTEPSTS